MIVSYLTEECVRKSWGGVCDDDILAMLFRFYLEEYIMKRFFTAILLVTIISCSVFAEVFTTEKEQRIAFINSTKIEMTDKTAETIAPNLWSWKNAVFLMSINDNGNILVEVVIEPDKFSILDSTTFLSWLYYNIAGNITDETQRNDFYRCGFFVNILYKLPRGNLNFYAALRKNGRVMLYDNFKVESGSYSGEVRDFYPSYNSVTGSWNSAYLYYYIIGDFERIKDMPVPPGLDDSFKNEE